MSYENAEYQAGQEQVAQFALGDDPGLSVDPDEDDNAGNHGILHSESGTMVGFTVFNVGTVAGQATVDIYVDGEWKKSWTSSDIPAGRSESTFVKGIGRYPKGGHDFAAYVTPD